MSNVADALHPMATTAAMPIATVDAESVVEDEVEDESTYEKFERGIVDADLAKVEEAVHQEVMQNGQG